MIQQKDFVFCWVTRRVGLVLEKYHPYSIINFAEKDGSVIRAQYGAETLRNNCQVMTAKAAEFALKGYAPKSPLMEIIHHRIQEGDGNDPVARGDSV